MQRLEDVSENVPLASCKRCKHYLRGLLWDICVHPSSNYKSGDVVAQHTVKHMRICGACGYNATLFAPK